MKRREFLIAAGTAGLSAVAGTTLAQQKVAPATKSAKMKAPKRQGATMVGYADKPLSTVRVGFIGVGARGSGHVEQMLLIQGVEIKAISDLYQDLADNAAKACTDKGRAKPALYVNGKEGYKAMLDRDDIDIVIIATPWEWHVQMCVDAMNAGKHAFTEVPAAYTLDDCWRLVDTSEKTRRHCMMMENVNYGRDELLCLNMCRLGVFGELLHGEAAYIHDLRGQMNEVVRGTGSWRTVHYQHRDGNLYPTHGLGPVAHYMDINHGDRFDYMTSMSCNSRVRTIYGADHFPKDHKWNTTPFVCGDINTSMIKTVRGKTIMVQWDEQLPRPYTRHNFIQGTKGAWGGFPNRCVIDGLSKSTDTWEQTEDLQKFFDKYDHPLWKKVAGLPENQGGHGGMDFVMLWRLVYCLRNGMPVDQDVYDAAAWSAVSPLSEWSVANRGQSVDFPDFTRGAWENRASVTLDI